MLKHETITFVAHRGGFRYTTCISDFWMNTLNLKVSIYSRSRNYRGLHESLCESYWHICFPLSWQQSYQHFGWMPNVTVQNLSDVHHLFRVWASLSVWEQHIWNLLACAILVMYLTSGFGWIFYLQYNFDSLARFTQILHGNRTYSFKDSRRQTGH